MSKSTKPLDMLQDLPGAIRVATPNLLELRSMYQVCGGVKPTSSRSPAGRWGQWVTWELVSVIYLFVDMAETV